MELFYYKDSVSGEVFQFENEEQRQIYGAATLVRMTAAEIDAHLNPPPPPVTSEMVNAERDKRIDAGFDFEGHHYQSRMTDRENIAGCAQLAFMAMVGGAEAGNYRWSDEAQDFVWIDADNQLVKMDAQTVVGLGKAAAGHKQALIFKARDLKSMTPVPADFQDDKWW